MNILQKEKEGDLRDRPRLAPTPTPTPVPTPTPTPTPTPPVTPGPADAIRSLPATPLSPGQTFDVTVTFIAPSDSFNLIRLTDNAPAGWVAQGNTTASTPNAAFVNTVGGQIQFPWMGNYSAGTAFTVQYKVTVPSGATVGIYTFSGQLGYKTGGGSTVFETIAGDSMVQPGQTPVTGITREVNIMAAATGNHTVVAHKDGFRERTQTISIAGLSQEFAVTCNFQRATRPYPQSS